jgi:hypothetical protein
MDFQGMMVDFQGTIAWKPTTRRAATELMHLIFPNFRTGNFSCKRLWKNRRAGCHLLLLCCPPPKKKSAQELAINPSLHHAPHANSKPKTPSSQQPNSWKPQILQLIDLIYDLLLHLKTKSTNPSSSLSSSSSPYTSLLSTMFATPYKH